MDHIEQVQDPTDGPLQIPCLSPQPYDQLDYMSYPERAGWDKSRLWRGDFSQHPPRETAAFLQNWLYFGVLWEALGENGHKDNYVKPQHGTDHGIVTAKLLDAHLYQRAAYLKNLFQKDVSSGRATVNRIERCLTVLSWFCRRATCHGDPRPGFTVWPLSPEVDLSVRVLGQRLAVAMPALISVAFYLNHLGALVFPCGYLPMARMAAAGWCPSEISMVSESFSSASAYYASQLRRPSRAVPLDHSRCSNGVCVARQVDEDTYRTRHSTEDCRCELLGPPTHEIVSMIRSGRIPLLSIASTETSPYLKVNVESLRPGERYIAFSHVWSDGLGNPSTNRLPLCQLQRIRSLLEELAAGMSTADLVNRLAFSTLWRKFHGPSVRFWMDTLCIPVEPQYKEFRSLAIKKMKDVYEHAYRVAVLDAALEACSSRHYTEACMRISLSAWMRRLWTLQEGVLANRMCVKFADGFFDVRAAYKARDRERRGTGEALDVQKIFGTPSCDADSFHWKFRLLRVNVLGDPDPRMVYKTTDMGTPPEQRRCYAIMEAFSAALYRSTSKEADEFICFASLIGWDISLLKSRPLEEQMHALLSREAKLPQGLLFLAGPRMRHVGWRWAINRFGNCGAARLNVKFNDFTPGIVNDRGFVVEYPGLILPLSCSKRSLHNLVVRAETGEGTTTLFHISRHHDGLDRNGTSSDVSQVESDSQPCALYVVFFDSTRSMPPAAPMAAAVLSTSRDKYPVALQAEYDLVYQFEFVAYLEILASVDGEVLPQLQPPDGQFVAPEMAQLVRRRWTIS